MLASSQGGINIEEVAVENPESILTEPVDILTGLEPDQSVKVATFMGFEDDKVEQVCRQIFNFLPYVKWSVGTNWDKTIFPQFQL